jgi:hypothetical protein
MSRFNFRVESKPAGIKGLFADWTPVEVAHSIDNANRVIDIERMDHPHLQFRVVSTDEQPTYTLRSRP